MVAHALPTPSGVRSVSPPRDSAEILKQGRSLPLRQVLEPPLPEPLKEPSLELRPRHALTSTRAVYGCELS